MESPEMVIWGDPVHSGHAVMEKQTLHMVTSRGHLNPIRLDLEDMSITT